MKISRESRQKRTDKKVASKGRRRDRQKNKKHKQNPTNSRNKLEATAHKRRKGSPISGGIQPRHEDQGKGNGCNTQQTHAADPRPLLPPFWMAMRLSCKFRFHIGILNQHWLVEQGRRPMTDWPAADGPKLAIARNHAATVEEDIIRETPVMPTGGQACRWQAITDTTTIESSLVDLKEKGTTPQDRRFLYVDCMKRTTAAWGLGVETIEPDHHLLNHLVTSFVAQVERAASVGSRAGTAVGNPDVVRLPASSRSTGRRQVGSHERFSEAGSRAHAQTGNG